MWAATDDKNFPLAWGFSTPPPRWRSSSYSRNPSSPLPWKSEKKPLPSKVDAFHVIHKVPVGDSPYVKAKRVQLIDKDPSRAISLFWAAINSGDRIDSALKDMAVVMKQLNRSEEAIEAIKSFRHLCSPDSQESLDNVLVELYKRSGRLDEQIEILKVKLKRIEDGTAFGGKRTKMARSQGKKVHITVEQEYARLLGNLAWTYLQQNDYEVAAEHYRKALSIELDRNKQCNLALCLLHMNEITEAKLILQATRASAGNRPMDESYKKSFERAAEFLAEIESDSFRREQENNSENQFPLAMTGRNGKGRTLFAEIERKPDHQLQFDNEDNTSGLSEENPGSLPHAHKSDFSHSFTYTPPVVPWRAEPASPFTQPKTSLRKGTSNGPNRRLQFEAPLVPQNAEAFSHHVGRVALLQKPSEPPLFCASKDWSRTVWGHPVGTKSMIESKFKSGSCKGQGHSWNTNMPADSTLDPTNVSADCQKKTGGQEKPEEKELIVSMLKKSPTFVEEPKIPETLVVQDFQIKKSKKSWADMVEEEEQELVIELPVAIGLCPSTDLSLPSNTENLDWDMSYAEQHLSRKFKSFDLEDNENASSGKCSSSKSTTASRSLSFVQQEKQEMDYHCSSSPNTDIKMEVDDMSRVPADESKPNLGNKCVFRSTRRNRLQVFQDIALLPGSPRA